jgi:hypothetical protein
MSSLIMKMLLYTNVVKIDTYNFWTGNQYVPFHRECQSHVDAGREGDGREGVEKVRIEN